MKKFILLSIIMFTLISCKTTKPFIDSQQKKYIESAKDTIFLNSINII